jgi:agmatine/peptidylarginine deiminase
MGLIAYLPNIFTDPEAINLKAEIRTESLLSAMRLCLPAEWQKQSCIQLTWPHEGTDWQPILKDVIRTYISLTFAIASREKLIIVTPDIKETKMLIKSKLPGKVLGNIFYHQCPTNDTWARDHAFITLRSEQGCHLLDFKFNGWGEKFAADKDNAINKSLFDSGIVKGTYVNHLDFTLEGGSIESDGIGTIFTTSHCLLAPHRNQPMSRIDIEEKLKKDLHADRIVWIEHGLLTGDDTDGHIDTLIRTAPADTLLYVGCDDKNDEQYDELKAMENELKALRTIDDRAYRLIKLPMPDAIYDGKERLPATYANFLIINRAIIYPTYNQPENDEKARRMIQSAFQGYEMVNIDSRTLIRQHGSIHCTAMQYPAGTFNLELLKSTEQ